MQILNKTNNPELTCNFLIADPSLLKWSSLAALTLRERDPGRTTLCGLPNRLPEMEAKDDNLFEENASFLSMARPLGAANVPAEDMAANVDAISIT